MRRWICAVFCAIMTNVSFASEKIDSAEKMDDLLEREVFLLTHGDDMDAALQHMIDVDGVPPREIAASSARIARKLMNEPTESLSGYACNAALYMLGEYGDEKQLLELLSIAMTATNRNAGSAILSYHCRKRDTLEFCDAVEKFVTRKNLPRSERSVAWCALFMDAGNTKDLDPVVQKRILNIANQHILIFNENTRSADNLLARYEPGYAKSEKRLRVVEEILRHHTSGALNAKYSEIKKSILEVSK